MGKIFQLTLEQQCELILRAMWVLIFAGILWNSIFATIWFTIVAVK